MKQNCIFDENISLMKLSFDGTRFAKHLRQKRIIDEDIDLRTLAKKLDISPATLSRCEKGSMPELITYAKLCRWIKQPMNEFIKSK